MLQFYPMPLEVKSNFPALGARFKYLLRALIGSFHYLCFFYWPVLLPWFCSIETIPFYLRKENIFREVIKARDENNRKKGEDVNQRLANSRSLCFSLHDVVKSQRNVHCLISAYLANLVTSSVNQHSFVIISATQPCKSCIRLTIPNSQVTVLF